MAAPGFLDKLLGFYPEKNYIEGKILMKAATANTIELLQTIVENIRHLNTNNPNIQSALNKTNALIANLQADPRYFFGAQKEINDLSQQIMQQLEIERKKREKQEQQAIMFAIIAASELANEAPVYNAFAIAANNALGDNQKMTINVNARTAHAIAKFSAEHASTALASKNIQFNTSRVSDLVEKRFNARGNAINICREGNMDHSTDVTINTDSKGQPKSDSSAAAMRIIERKASILQKFFRNKMRPNPGGSKNADNDEDNIQTPKPS